MTILTEKITGGSSGTPAIMYFFSKKADIQTHPHTHGNPILPTAGVSSVQQIRNANKQARYRGPRRGPGSPRYLSRRSHWAPGRSCDEAAQAHRPRLAKPYHSSPFLYSDRWGHCALQRDSRPCMVAVLSPLLPQFGGGGSGLILYLMHIVVFFLALMLFFM